VVRGEKSGMEFFIMAYRKSRRLKIVGCDYGGDCALQRDGPLVDLAGVIAIRDFQFVHR
jgi:hypothetical protein